MNSWPILALLGCLIILVLFVADWDMHEHLDDLSKMRPPPHSALYADPNLKHF
jgi:predicted exporter